MTLEITDEMVGQIHAELYGNCCPPDCNCDGNQWERAEVRHFLTAALPIIEKAVREQYAADTAEPGETPMTTDQEMRELADAATQGPWDAYRPYEAYRIYELCSTTEQGLNETLAEVSGYNASADAEFIAACRQWVPDAIRRIEAVREIHQPIKALNTRYPGGKLTQVCTGCGQDDGNWNQWPCPTIRALDGDK